MGERWTALRKRHRALDHAVRAGTTYSSDNGNQYAAAITYFSVLALFPLLLLGMSVAGFVLASQPQLFTELQHRITGALPGALGATVGKVVTTAVDDRGAVGVVGLVGLAYSGLGWIGNLRTGVQAMWTAPEPAENWALAKLRDLLILVGLGASALVSLGLTAGGTAATNLVVRTAHLSHVPGIGVATRAVGIIVAILADVLIFGWMLSRLPRRPVPTRALLRGSLLAAIGFEILKVAGTYYIARVAKSPTYGLFGGFIGLFLWVNLVARLLLFVTAWTATAPETAAATAAESASAVAATAQPPGADAAGGSGSRPSAAGSAGDGAKRNTVRRAGRPSAAVIAASIFGAGAAAGGIAVAALRRWDRRRW